MARPPSSPKKPATDPVHEEEAGAREPFEDAVLYDYEYRRRRADIRFYLRLAEERTGDRPGPVLDLACGSGRLLQPLLRAGHTVVGVDHSAPMLARAAARIDRLSPTRRARALVVRGDLRRLPVCTTNEGSFTMAICAFHSLQHLVDDADLRAFFRGVFSALVPGGWHAFDVLPPDPSWIRRDPERRWGRTRFRHPGTGQRFESTDNHTYDPARRALHIRLYYQPLDEHGAPAGHERIHRLCHRQLTPDEIAALVTDAGLELLTSFGGFDGRPRDGREPAESDDVEHIYVCRRPRSRSAKTSGKSREIP